MINFIFAVFSTKFGPITLFISVTVKVEKRSLSHYSTNIIHKPVISVNSVSSHIVKIEKYFQYEKRFLIFLLIKTKSIQCTFVYIIQKNSLAYESCVTYSHKSVQLFPFSPSKHYCCCESLCPLIVTIIFKLLTRHADTNGD